MRTAIAGETAPAVTAPALEQPVEEAFVALRRALDRRLGRGGRGCGGRGVGVGGRSAGGRGTIAVAAVGAEFAQPFGFSRRIDDLVRIRRRRLPEEEPLG